jgi:hypothetical protein
VPVKGRAPIRASETEVRHGSLHVVTVKRFVAKRVHAGLLSTIGPFGRMETPPRCYACWTVKRSVLSELVRRLVLLASVCRARAGEKSADAEDFRDGQLTHDAASG